jgi:hypothetical protein
MVPTGGITHVHKWFIVKGRVDNWFIARNKPFVTLSLMLSTGGGKQHNILKKALNQPLTRSATKPPLTPHCHGNAMAMQLPRHCDGNSGSTNANTPTKNYSRSSSKNVSIHTKNKRILFPNLYNLKIAAMSFFLKKNATTF